MVKYFRRCRNCAAPRISFSLMLSQLVTPTEHVHSSVWGHTSFRCLCGFLTPVCIVFITLCIPENEYFIFNNLLHVSISAGKHVSMVSFKHANLWAVISASNKNYLNTNRLVVLSLMITVSQQGRSELIASLSSYMTHI